MATVGLVGEDIDLESQPTAIILSAEVAACKSKRNVQVPNMQFE